MEPREGLVVSGMGGRLGEEDRGSLKGEKEAPGAQEAEGSQSRVCGLVGARGAGPAEYLGSCQGQGRSPWDGRFSWPLGPQASEGRGAETLLRSWALHSHRPTPDPRIHQGILALRYLDFATVY